MLNYIWAGLIIFSLVFALVNDVRDLSSDRYRNGKSLPVTIVAAKPGAKDVKVRIDQTQYQSFYGVPESVAAEYPATLIETSKGRELVFAKGGDLPTTLNKIRDATAGDNLRGLFSSEEPKKSLQAKVTAYELASDGSAVAQISFEPVRWVSLDAISTAAMQMSRTAIEISLQLIGTLALFLGIMQIAEKSGLIQIVVLVTGPILRPLFPGIPKGHPAMGLVTLNLTANMLGLGNAATPFGLKAMEELQKLNKTTDTATNAMVMLLAMNTAGIQLLPPLFLYAVMGLRASELYFPILIVTGICLVIAIIAAKLFERVGGYRASDPDRLAAAMEAA